MLSGSILFLTKFEIAFVMSGVIHSMGFMRMRPGNLGQQFLLRFIIHGYPPSFFLMFTEKTIQG